MKRGVIFPTAKREGSDLSDGDIKTQLKNSGYINMTAMVILLLRLFISNSIFEVFYSPKASYHSNLPLFHEMDTSHRQKQKNWAGVMNTKINLGTS